MIAQRTMQRYPQHWWLYLAVALLVLLTLLLVAVPTAARPETVPTFGPPAGALTVAPRPPTLPPIELPPGAPPVPPVDNTLV